MHVIDSIGGAIGLHVGVLSVHHAGRNRGMAGLSSATQRPKGACGCGWLGLPAQQAPREATAKTPADLGAKR